MDVLERIAAGLRAGEHTLVAELTQDALDQGLAAPSVLDDGLLAGMQVVGERFRAREIFLPDVLLAARAMHAGLEILEPHLLAEGVPSAGKVVLGTVRGDMHDIGKTLVGIMLRSAGYDIVDLGTGVEPERFIEAAQEHGARVVGVSALLTTTMPVMGEVTDLVRERQLSEDIKVIVGGAPVTEGFAQEIGADAYAFDATNAVDRVRALIGDSR
jgi:5-methyltetrahydrofolate--homocysteine methyltransferase